MERYLLENGFTCAPPTNEAAYAPRRLMEEFLSSDDVASSRRCEFKRSAYSYQLHGNNGATFIFKQDRPPHLAHMATIDKDGTIWVNESYCDLREEGFLRLPPNTSLERTRER